MAFSIIDILIAVNILILPIFLGWIQIYESFLRIMIERRTALTELRTQDTAPEEVENYAIMLFSFE